MEENKPHRWWIVGVFIVLILAIALLFGYLFFKKSPTDSGVSSSANFGGGAPDTGQNPNTTTPGALGSGGVNTQGKNPIFVQITKTPVSGMTLVGEKTNYRVRYVDRATGHIFDTSAESGENPVLVSNTTIPRVYEAYWANGGQVVVYRYLEKDELSSRDTIKTYLATIGNAKIDGRFLPDNISDIAMSPNGTRLLYLLPSNIGSSGVIVDLPGGATHSAFTSPLREWIPQLLSNGNTLLASKPSWNIPGFSYQVAPGTNVFSGVIRQKNGLTILARDDGKRAVWAENVGNQLTTGISGVGQNTDEGRIIGENILPFSTLPEKCSWSQNGIQLICAAALEVPENANIPDDWYQGRVNFNDSVWLANSDTGEASLLGDPKTEVGRGLDITHPEIAPDEKRFYFIDKNDGTLWMMRVEQTLSDAPVILPTKDELKDVQGSSLPK